jgi:hypothetical protein
MKKNIQAGLLSIAVLFIFIYFGHVFLNSGLVASQYRKILHYFNDDFISNKKNKLFKVSRLIAHAGGEVSGIATSNSWDALELSHAKGYRFIELDFGWTNDGYLVLLHDWEGSMPGLFNEPPGHYSLDQFLNFKMAGGLKQLSLDGLADWLRQHPDTYIITDIKRFNIEGLKKIKELYPELIENFIPQIYFFDEYAKARNIGYENIILTLYQTEYTNEEVVNFAANNSITAVTVPIDQVSTGLPTILKKEGVITLTHTVNSKNLLEKLYSYNIYGAYTDTLIPE